MNELIAIISDLVPSKKQISGIRASTLMGGVSSLSVSVCHVQWRVLQLCQQGKLRPWDISHSQNNRCGTCSTNTRSLNRSWNAEIFYWHFIPSMLYDNGTNSPCDEQSGDESSGDEQSPNL